MRDYRDRARGKNGGSRTVARVLVAAATAVSLSRAHDDGGQRRAGGGNLSQDHHKHWSLADRSRDLPIRRKCLCDEPGRHDGQCHQHRCYPACRLQDDHGRVSSKRHCDQPGRYPPMWSTPSSDTVAVINTTTNTVTGSARAPLPRTWRSAQSATTPTSRTSPDRASASSTPREPAGHMSAHVTVNGACPSGSRSALMDRRSTSRTNTEHGHGAERDQLRSADPRVANHSGHHPDPTSIAFVPGTQIAYVVNSGSNTVSVVNTSTSPATVTTSVGVGLQPEGDCVHTRRSLRIRHGHERLHTGHDRHDDLATESRRVPDSHRHRGAGRRRRDT